MDTIDMNKVFSSKRYVFAKYVAMVCFFIYLFLMVCLCVVLIIRRAFNRSRSRRPQNDEMVRQVPPSNAINQEEIQMSVLNTIP